MESLSTLLEIGGAAIFLSLILVVAVYVAYCLAWSRVLHMYNYKNAWMAWIPYAQYYALADAAFEKKDKIKFLSWEVPTFIFKFWWVVPIINLFVSNASMTYAVMFAQSLCLGTVFAHIFAKAEGKTYDDMKFFSLVTGWFPIIAMIKFFGYKKNLRFNPDAEQGTTPNYESNNVNPDEI